MCDGISQCQNGEDEEDCGKYISILQYWLYSSLHNDNISENEAKPLTVQQGDSIDLI